MSMQTTAVHMSKTISGMEIKISSQPNGEHMTPEDLEKVKGVVMLVDNSNTWITDKSVAAQKQQLEKQQLKSEDPRWRLEVGKLYYVVMQGSDDDHELVRIFGSIPPPAEIPPGTDVTYFWTVPWLLVMPCVGRASCSTAATTALACAMGTPLRQRVFVFLRKDI
jgi:hypothetical protein